MIRLGFVGGGAVSQFCHMSNFTEIKGCSVVALAEHRPELRRKVAAKFGIPNIYETHHEMLERADLDAVVVVTQPAVTGPIVLDALRAGRHVLSEKPMAHTVEQARRLVEQAEGAGVQYVVGFMKRHDAGVQYARARLQEFLQTQELGPIAFVRAYCFMGDDGRDGAGFVMTDELRGGGRVRWPVAPSWLPEASHERYASFLTVTCHDLNLLRYLLDCTPRVTTADLSRSRGSYIGLDFGTCSGVFEFGVTDLPRWHEGVDIQFERGSVHITLNAFPIRAPAAVEVVTPGHTAHAARVVLGNSWAFRRQAEAFVIDLLDGREPLASGADSILDLELAEEIWKLAVDAPIRVPAAQTT